MTTVVNPLTKRQIKINGAVYKKLVRDGVIKSGDTVGAPTATKKKRVVWKPIPQPTESGFTTVIDHRGAIVRYDPHFIPNAKKYFDQLAALFDQSKHEKRLFGDGDAKRRTLQVADPDARLYNYSTTAAEATHHWEEFPVLVALKKLVEEATGESFNFALVNFYTPDANLGWHSDDEKDMVDEAIVASLSFGGERPFDLEEKFAEPMRKRIVLLSGSLLTMEKKCQKIFRHRVPPKKIDKLRINITFRKMHKK